MPVTHQASIGIERQLSANLSLQVTYQMLRSRDQMRSINLNQPVIVGTTIDPRGTEVPLYVRPDTTVVTVLPQIGALLGFAALFAVIGLSRFRFER